MQFFFLGHTEYFQSEFLQSFLDEIDMKILPVIGKAIKFSIIYFSRHSARYLHGNDKQNELIIVKT